MITETYRKIEIVLLEDENAWRFTANGRERKAPSLPKAREYIDNALDKVETKAVKQWEPFEAWTNDGYGANNWRKVKITSIADRDYSSQMRFWTVGKTKDRWGHEKSERKKISEVWLYADSPTNAAAIAQIQSLVEQAKRIDTEISEVRSSMMRMPKPSEDAL